MTYKQRNVAYSEAANYDDVDAYVSDLALSSLWGDAEGADITAERIRELRRLWQIYHLPVRELIAPMTITQAAEALCVPYRTIQCWCAPCGTNGHRPCAPHLRLWIAETIGYGRASGGRA